MARVCVMLCNIFPFARGEEFIELEMPRLAAAFDHVVVAATKTRPGDEQTRPVPENVTVVRAGRQVSPRDLRTVARLGALGVRTMPRDAWTAHPGRLGLEALFEGRSRASLADLIAQAEAHAEEWGLVPGNEVSLYAYWLNTTARTALLFADWLRARGVHVNQVVSRAHHYEIHPTRAPFQHLPQQAALLRALDHTYAVSDAGRRVLQEAAPDASDRIETRHLGTRDPGAVNRPTNQPFHVVTIAFVSPVKRLDLVAPLLAQVAAAGTPVRWTHIGAGDDLDGLRDQAVALLGQSSVEFLGYVPNTQLMDHLRRLDPSVLLSVSESEGLPVTMIEAASLGLPIVATEVGGVAEICRDGLTGRLLPADADQQRCVAVLQDVARAGSEQLAEYGARGRELWAAEFDEAKVYPAFAAELQR